MNRQAQQRKNQMEEFKSRVKSHCNIKINCDKIPPAYQASVVKGKVCIFCFQSSNSLEKFGGLIHHKTSKISVHYFCLLLASGLGQRCSDSECDIQQTPNAIHGFLISDILKEFHRSLKLKCNYCLKNGASIGCTVPKCNIKFHFNCGLKHGVLNQYFGKFSSFCKTHKPTQDSQDFDNSDSEVKNCCICLDVIKRKSFNKSDVLFSPCCKDTWLHRGCVEKQAMSFGMYYFRCSACNNKEDFSAEMLRMGIYVPERDASWETPEAFADLLSQTVQCDITICKCVHGRKHDTNRSQWSLLVCLFCGSSGAHVACTGLPSSASPYACDICTSVHGSAGVRKHFVEMGFEPDTFFYHNDLEGSKLSDIKGSKVKCLAERVMNEQITEQVTPKRKRNSENAGCSRTTLRRGGNSRSKRIRK